jgi:transposase
VWTNRFIRWSRLGVFARIFTVLAAAVDAPDRLMIDAPHRTAPRRACAKRGCSAVHRTNQSRPELQAARRM